MNADLAKDCTEYIDGLTSVELAMMMAMKYKESPNHAVRRTAKKVSKRLRAPIVRSLFKNLSMHHAPIGVVTAMRNELDNII